MKTKILFSAAIVLAGSVLASQAAPADEVTSAAQKLAGESSYTWHMTTVVPDNARFKPGPVDGKIADGMTYVKTTMRDNDIEVIIKGTNAVATNPDGDWQTLDQMQADAQGPSRFIVGMVHSFKSPAAQAADLASSATDLQMTNGAYAGDLPADTAKGLLAFRRPNATVSNPSGTVQFWVANGELTKFEYHVKGTMTMNGNDTEMDRDSTVEISAVGSTKIDVPDDAKKLLP